MQNAVLAVWSRREPLLIEAVVQPALKYWRRLRSEVSILTAIAVLPRIACRNGARPGRAGTVSTTIRRSGCGTSLSRRPKVERRRERHHHCQNKAKHCKPPHVYS